MQPDPKIFSKIFEDFQSRHGRAPSVEEYAALWEQAIKATEEQEAHERLKRMEAMFNEVYSLIELLVHLETLAEDDNLIGFEQGRLEICQSLLANMSEPHRKSIAEHLRGRRRRSMGSAIGEYFTEERQLELDQDIMRGVSGIYGMRLRARNGWKDKGNYAGKLCLITRHGWAPVVVPNGVPGLLRELGILDYYRDKLPTHHDPVPLRRQDRFDIEWERLADGTRSFVRVKSSEH